MFLRIDVAPNDQKSPAFEVHWRSPRRPASLAFALNFGVSLLSFLLFPVAGAWAQDAGDPDPHFNEFDTQGYVSLDIPHDNDQANDLAIDSQGRILVATCDSTDSTPYKARIRRYTKAGVLDTNFATNGVYTMTKDVEASCAVQVALDTADNVYAATEYPAVGPDFDIQVEKLAASNGALLSSKAVLFDLGTTFTDRLGDVAVSGGKVAVGGFSTVSTGDLDLTIALLNTSDLSFDTGFSTDGKMSIAIDAGGNNQDLLTAIAFAGTKILVVGYSDGPNGATLGSAARVDASGNLDTTFGDDDGARGQTGRSTYAYVDNLGTSDFNLFFDVHVQQDGTILIAGTTTPSGLFPTKDMAFVKLNGQGNQVLGFGDNGWVLQGFSLFDGDTDDFARFIDVDGFGNVLIGGLVASTSSSQRLFGVVQFDQSGNLDSDFGSAGKALLLVPGQLDHDAYGGRFANDEDFVVVGYHLPNGQADWDSFVMRLVGSQMEIFSDGFESGNTNSWN